MGFIGFSLVFRGCIGSCFGGFLGCPLYTLCVLKRRFALFLIYNTSLKNIWPCNYA